MCVLQDLTATVVNRAQAGPTEVVEELKARLALKEKLFQELLSDRSRQSSEHQAQVQDLLSTLSSKDQYLQVGQTRWCRHAVIKMSLGRVSARADAVALSGLLPPAVPGDQRAEQPAAGTAQADVIPGAGAAAAEAGARQRGGTRDGAPAQPPQRERGPNQGAC